MNPHAALNEQQREAVLHRGDEPLLVIAGVVGGVLGGVGPRRMPYSDVMAVVDETARIVSGSLSRVRQHLYLP